MTMFRKHDVTTRAQPDSSNVANPYLSARREWMERYGDYVQSAYHWRLFALFLLVICFASVGGMIWSSSQNHFIPYIVQVDKLGSALSVGVADQASAVDVRIVRSQLARWVTNVRSVYVDGNAERIAIEDAYALVAHASPAFQYINSIFEKQSPFDRAQKETVSVEVHTVLQETKETWRVEWKENTYARSGELERTEEWQAVLTAVMSPSDNEAVLLRNPTGIYIQSLDWSKKL